MIISLVEFFFPLRSFLVWKIWIANRYFPVHGLALIFIGLPLTLYKGYLSSVIFIIGLFIVFTGPFILIYPEKIRKAFNDSAGSFDDNQVRGIVFIDAFFRLCAGLIFLVSCWKTFKCS